MFSYIFSCKGTVFLWSKHSRRLNGWHNGSLKYSVGKKRTEAFTVRWRHTQISGIWRLKTKWPTSTIQHCTVSENERSNARFPLLGSVSIDAAALLENEIIVSFFLLLCIHERAIAVYAVITSYTVYIHEVRHIDKLISKT